MASTAERAFRRRIESLLGQIDNLEASALQRSLELLGRARRDIAARLAEVPADSFTATHLLQLNEGIRRTTAEMLERYRGDLDQTLEQAVALGAELGVTPGILGAEISSLPFVPRRLVEVLQGYSATLVQGLSEFTRRRIDLSLNRVALGISTPHEAILEIAGDLKKPSVFRSLLGRAEAIVRTEVNRAFSAATQARLSQVAAETPGLKKQWLTAGDARVRRTHVAVGGVIVGANETFPVGGYAALYPRDPVLPARETVNCRCRVIPVVDADTLRSAGLEPPPELLDEPAAYPDAVTTADEVTTAFSAMQAVTTELSGLPSAWNGQARITFSGAGAVFEWDGSLSVRAELVKLLTEAEKFRVLLHEMGHAISVEADKAAFARFGPLEEGVAEMWARLFGPQVARKLGKAWKTADWIEMNGYPEFAVPLERLRGLVGEKPREFYRGLIGTGLAKRRQLLLDKAGEDEDLRDQIRTILESM